MEMFTSIKLDLSQKVFDRFKELTILAIAAYFDYEIWQMDVKTAFLNGNLTENVYMMQPEGFIDPTNAGKICNLQKSIYGLK